jgi:hypothetical protein
MHLTALRAAGGYAPPVDAAASYSYTLVATNTAGPSTALAVQAVDTLPSGVLFVGKNAASTDWSCAEAPAGTVTCDLTPDLAAGAAARGLILDVTAPDETGLVTTVTAAEEGFAISGAGTLTVSNTAVTCRRHPSGGGTAIDLTNVGGTFDADKTTINGCPCSINVANAAAASTFDFGPTVIGGGAGTGPVVAARARRRSRSTPSTSAGLLAIAGTTNSNPSRALHAADLNLSDRW